MNRKPPSQEQALKRHALRAHRWLANLLVVLPIFERIAPAGARIWLDQRLTLLARFALDFIFFRAAHARRAPVKVRNPFQAALAARRRDVRMQVQYSLRAALGGRLRRSLKARGFKARAKAILFALRNRDQLAARLVRRMQSGLSRRMTAHCRVMDARSATIAPAVLTPDHAGVSLRADTS